MSRLNQQLRRSGFTLVEMLVSVAVLTLALGAIFVVFNVTTRTTTQAAALSEAQTWVRQFLFELQKDLDAIVPGESVLVVDGRTVSAARTQDGLDANRYWRVLVGDPLLVPNGFDPEQTPGLADNLSQYSDPRADVMMFVTNRVSASQAPVETDTDPSRNPLLFGTKQAPVLVTYGHAAKDQWVLVDGSESIYAFSGLPRHIATDDNNQISPLPLTRWFLARRAILIWDADIGADMFDGPLYFGRHSGGWPPLLQCTPINPPGNRLSSALQSATNAGDCVVGNFQDYLRQFQGITALESPYDQTFWMGSTLAARALDGTLYDTNSGSARRIKHFATILEQPPANLRSNLGLHALPACAWFQVEFLMPEDPRNGADYSPDPRPGSLSASERFDPPRWTQVPNGQRYVFVPDSTVNREGVLEALDRGDPNLNRGFGLINPNQPATGQNVRVRMWPYAVRVTVRVFDKRGRLEEPIVRTLVHRFD